MKQILASHMLSAIMQMERVEVLLSERKKSEDFDEATEIPKSVRNHIATRYSRLSTCAEAMGAAVTSRLAEQSAKRLRRRTKPINFNDLGTMTKQLSSVLEIEMGEAQFYCLNPGAAEFYSPDEPLFGEVVDIRIPKASDDISEAGKCFAVGRYTSSVFHLMRAMEAAVQKLSSQLGIENVDREWGKLLSDIGKKIEAMPKGDERDEWSEAHANLYHVKQAWRIDTMHPKATYTEEEAREVFDAMRAFMRHLATLLPPDLSELVG